MTRRTATLLTRAQAAGRGAHPCAASGSRPTVVSCHCRSTSPAGGLWPQDLARSHWRAGLCHRCSLLPQCVAAFVGGSALCSKSCWVHHAPHHVRVAAGCRAAPTNPSPACSGRQPVGGRHRRHRRPRLRRVPPAPLPGELGSAAAACVCAAATCLLRLFRSPREAGVQPAPASLTPAATPLPPPAPPDRHDQRAESGPHARRLRDLLLRPAAAHLQGVCGQRLHPVRAGRSWMAQQLWS